MLLCSNNLSAIAKVSSLIMREFFPVCFCCNNNFVLSQSSKGSDEKNIVEIPETMKTGELSNFI